jgi:hypothetical protein
MGYQDSNYKGFYIVVTPNMVREEYQETRCINSNCDNSKKEIKEKFDFCPKCGSKIDWVDVFVIERDSFYNYSELKIPDISDSKLCDWFWSPEYINELIDENWCEFDTPKDSKIIICNRDFYTNFPSEKDRFMKHPATKLLLEKMNCNYEIKYGLVAYSA